MTQAKTFRELMSRLGVFSVAFSVTVVTAVVLFVWAIRWDGWLDNRWPLLVVLAGAVLFETWPLTVLRYTVGTSTSSVNPYTIHLGQAFGFATLYIWGVQPAIVVTGVSWLLGQVFLRRPWWRALFNSSQFIVCMAAAGAVMALLGGAPLGVGPVFTVGDLPWLVGTWVVYFVVNDVLVALLYESDGSTFWRDLVDGSRWYLFAEVLVDTLSIVVVVLVAEGLFYPLALVVPMVLFAQTYNLTRLVEHESLHDDLTGLANRRQLIARLEEQVVRGSSYAVLIVDLDGFKQVNDTHGHHAGDAVLVCTADRLRTVVREHDLVARPSGDEFTVLLRERPTDEEAVEVARRVYRVVARPVPFGDQLLEVGASVGVVTLRRTDVLTVDDVLHRADTAMYQAKQSGGGVRQWTPATPGAPRHVEAAG
jgi:diguanylate cyclase (GGDEF)-like protein